MLLEHTQATTTALERFDNAAFYRATALAEETMACLREPITQDAAIAYHQMMALYAFIKTTPHAAVQAFQAILWLDPDHQLPAPFLEQPELRAAWAEARSRPGSGATPMALPPNLSAVIDGRPQAAIPSDRPSLLQLVGSSGEVLWSDWVVPGGDLTAWTAGGPIRCPDDYDPVVGECLSPLRVGSFDYQMPLIPAGSFLMGSPAMEAGRWGEEAQHTVKIRRAFYLGEVEIPQEMWRDVMGENPSRFHGATRPVEQVSWYDAVQFANRLSEREGLVPCYQVQSTQVSWPDDLDCEGYRLPTEAEWEYAARAGSPATYAALGDLRDSAWTRGSARGRTHPVGQLDPNSWRLYDMSGNVWEWTWSPYPETQGDQAALRVCRGGAWDSGPTGPRLANRGATPPDTQRSYLGLRLAITAR